MRKPRSAPINHGACSSSPLLFLFQEIDRLPASMGRRFVCRKEKSWPVYEKTMSITFARGDKSINWWRRCCRYGCNGCCGCTKRSSSSPGDEGDPSGEQFTWAVSEVQLWADLFACLPNGQEDGKHSDLFVGHNFKLRSPWSPSSPSSSSSSSHLFNGPNSDHCAPSSTKLSGLNCATNRNKCFGFTPDR